LKFILDIKEINIKGNSIILIGIYIRYKRCNLNFTGNIRGKYDINIILIYYIILSEEDNYIRQILYSQKNNI